MQHIVASCALALAVLAIGCSSGSAGSALADAAIVDSTAIDAPSDAPARTDTSSSESAPLAKCGFVSPDPRCEACIEASCCAAGRACAGSDDCVTQLRSQHACLDCKSLPPDDAVAFDLCLVKSCHLECGGTIQAGGAFHGYKGVGDPCSRPDSCITGRCSLAHACVRACDSDADCAAYPDLEGRSVVHVCVDNKKGQKLCLPRCDTNADCIVVTMSAGMASHTEPLRCAEVGASHKACILARDPGPVPGCYPNDSDLGGTPCASADDCLCGTDCIATSGTLRFCRYSCDSNDVCNTVSDGLLKLCFKGSGGGGCSN